VHAKPQRPTYRHAMLQKPPIFAAALAMLTASAAAAPDQSHPILQAPILQAPILQAPILPAPIQQPPILQPPVRPACITSPFGWRHAIGPFIPAEFHKGVDLAAPAGGEVRAAASGTIATIRRRGPGGLWVLINHQGGLSTLYAHLGTLWGRIVDGQRHVAAGDPIGHVGYSGLIRGTHVYFEVLQDNRPVDPEPLLGVPRCGQAARTPPTPPALPRGNPPGVRAPPNGPDTAKIPRTNPAGAS
jgi:murein DD-endopeptidase MepM/ murein hydrolase activator NlpD